MKKYTKTVSCLYILIRLLETNNFNKAELMLILDISELDYYRYKSEVITMLYDFGYYDVIERIKKV